VATRIVVNAAGAWASQVARMANVDVPVEPLRRMLVPSEPFDQYPHTAPMTIDMSNGFHFRPESLGFLLAWNDPDEPPSYNTEFDPAFIEKILGPVPDVAGLFLANGFSGHGVMHAPATGKILSDLILKGSTDLIDAELLSLRRFAEGKLIEETAVL
jgi:sarcosine oxidase subunit beta